MKQTQNEYSLLWGLHPVTSQHDPMFSVSCHVQSMAVPNAVHVWNACVVSHGVGFRCLFTVCILAKLHCSVMWSIIIFLHIAYSHSLVLFCYLFFLLVASHTWRLFLSLPTHLIYPAFHLLIPVFCLIVCLLSLLKSLVLFFYSFSSSFLIFSFVFMLTFNDFIFVFSVFYRFSFIYSSLM
jgi:hypothetical protein